MAASKTVAFAESVVTVHLTRTSEPGVLPDGSEAWDVESKIMQAGETLPLAVMPPYLSEAIKSGNVPGLVAITEAQAKKVSKFIDEQQTIGSFVNDEQESDPSFPAEEV
jgi:hypothetical protein